MGCFSPVLKHHTVCTNVHINNGDLVFVTADIPKCKKSDPMLPMCFMLATDILRPYLVKGEFTTFSLHINSMKINSDKLCPARILELDGMSYKCTTKLNDVTETKPYSAYAKE